MAEVRLTDRLPEFLSKVARHRRYDFARYNCFHLLNEWIMHATGLDPMRPYRDCCRTVAEARSLLRSGGGTAAIATAALAELGAREIEHPEGGDVVLVLAPIEHEGTVQWRETCAICVERGKFALLTSDLGLVIWPMKLVRAWSIAAMVKA